MYAHVRATRRLTPTLVRVVLEGGTLTDLVMPEATDAYVNVAIPPAGCAVRRGVRPARGARPAPEGRLARPPSLHGAVVGPVGAVLTLDFVVHGDTGVAGPWAGAVAPGDVLVFEGPSGGYLPDPGADWHLLVGDESALPAIAASLEALPDGARAVVRLVCDGPEHEIELTSRGEVDLEWLHRRGDAGDDDLLVAAVEALAFPEGRVHAFVHGEAVEIRKIRKHLLTDRGLSRGDMSCSPYWRRDMTDEAWRQVKRDFVAAMETEVA